MTRPRRRWSPLLLATGVVAAVGCGDASSERPLVLAASSLADVTQELVAAWGRPATVSEAGSQVIAAQLAAGAPAAVVVLADPAIAARLAAAGLAGEPQPVASTGLAVLVAARVAGRVVNPADLADRSLRVVLADVEVPLGAYTRRALGRLEIAGLARAGTAAAVLAGADSLEDAARPVVAKVTTGEADAAVVYRPDALAARRGGADLEVLSWPTEANVRAVYTAQVVNSPDAPDAAAFVSFLRSRPARRIWAAHGFQPPPA